MGHMVVQLHRGREGKATREAQFTREQLFRFGIAEIGEFHYANAVHAASCSTGSCNGEFNPRYSAVVFGMVLDIGRCVE